MEVEQSAAATSGAHKGDGPGEAGCECGCHQGNVSWQWALHRVAGRSATLGRCQLLAALAVAAAALLIYADQAAYPLLAMRSAPVLYACGGNGTGGCAGGNATANATGGQWAHRTVATDYFSNGPSPWRSVTQVAYMLAFASVGPLSVLLHNSRRVGHKPVLLAAGIASAAVSSLGAYAAPAGYGMAVAVRFATGLCHALVVAPATVIVLEMSAHRPPVDTTSRPYHGPQCIAVLIMHAVPRALAPALAAAAVSVAGDWRYACVALGAPLLLCAGAQFWLVPESALWQYGRGDAAGGERTLRRIARRNGAPPLSHAAANALRWAVVRLDADRSAGANASYILLRKAYSLLLNAHSVKLLFVLLAWFGVGFARHSAVYAIAFVTEHRALNTPVPWHLGTRFLYACGAALDLTGVIGGCLLVVTVRRLRIACAAAAIAAALMHFVTGPSACGHQWSVFAVALAPARACLALAADALLPVLTLHYYGALDDRPQSSTQATSGNRGRRRRRSTLLPVWPTLVDGDGGRPPMGQAQALCFSYAAGAMGAAAAAPLSAQLALAAARPYIGFALLTGCALLAAAFVTFVCLQPAKGAHGHTADLQMCEHVRSGEEGGGRRKSETEAEHGALLADETVVSARRDTAVALGRTNADDSPMKEPVHV